MRIIVYPHAMEIGGSQLNAVQLAGAVRDRGHEVIVVAEPGPLVEHLHAMNLEHVPIPARRRRPSPEVIALLTRLCRQRGVDVVHGYEWPPAVEGFLGPRLRLGTPVLATVMSSAVMPFFPRTIPLLVGIEELRDRTRAAGHRRVMLLEPPVDTDQDRQDPDSAAYRGFRASYDLSPDLPLVAMVCRLVPDLKRESLLATCAAIGELADAGRPVQLVIAGDGPTRAEVEASAARVNQRAGRRLVVLTGELADPRPVYAAADILVGMGGSALRAMAFAKPLIVVGENGFSELLTPDSVDRFLRDGWYGLGPGSRGAGPTGIRLAITELIDAPALRAELGGFGRDLVQRRFSLHSAAALQEQEYEIALGMRTGPADLAADVAQCVTGVVRYKIARKIARRRGLAATDDANARTLIEAAANRTTANRATERTAS
jgi:glycosyltransferase involved in cell wall biosynthesis